MKKTLFHIIAFAVCAALLLAATGALASDFGGFSGDSDFSFDSGSSWSSSDYDSDYGGGGGFFPIFISGGTGEGSGGEMSCSGGDMMMVIIIILIILVVIWYVNRHRQVPVTTTVQRTDDSMLTPMEAYTALDPNFSAVDMQKKLANLYVQMQDCWSAKDISSLRPYLTDELYEQSDRQLDEMRKNRQTPHVERISVLGTNLRGFFQKDGMDHMIVEMSTRINTYVTSDETGAIVRGDQNTEKFMTYEWDVVRPTGTQTGTEAPMQVVNCPNCGAPISINKTAKCPYCESVITVKANDWVLASIKGLSQRSN